MSVPDHAVRGTSVAGRAIRVVTSVLLIGLVFADETQVLGSPARHPRPSSLLVFWAVAFVAWVGTTVVHELGHLVVARVMLLPVGRVRLLPGRRGSGVPAHIRVVPSPDAVALPLRMVLTLLAGPAANLGLAACFWRLADRPGIGAEQHGLLLLPVILGAVVGAGNLVPFGRVRGLRLDGAQALAWLTRPAQMRKELSVKRRVSGNRDDADLLVAYSAEFQRGGVPDLVGLRAIADGPDVADALRAAVLLMGASSRAGEAEFVADVPRLIRAARNPRLRGDLAAAMGGVVAWQQSLELLNQMVRRKAEPDLERVAEIAELAEYAVGRDRSKVLARCALALARVIQDRAAEARDLLVGVDSEADSVKDRSNVFAVRSLAETRLGDLAQSRRLIEAARRLQGAASALLPLAEAMLTATERGATEGNVAEA